MVNQLPIAINQLKKNQMVINNLNNLERGNKPRMSQSKIMKKMLRKQSKKTRDKINRARKQILPK